MDLRGRKTKDTVVLGLMSTDFSQNIAVSFNSSSAICVFFQSYIKT